MARKVRLPERTPLSFSCLLNSVWSGLPHAHSLCKGADYAYRTDIPDTLDFLAEFGVGP